MLHPFCEIMQLLMISIDTFIKIHLIDSAKDAIRGNIPFDTFSDMCTKVDDTRDNLKWIIFDNLNIDNAVNGCITYECVENIVADIALRIDYLGDMESIIERICDTLIKNNILPGGIKR